MTQTKRLAFIYRYFLQEIKKGNAGDIQQALSMIRGAKARGLCVTLIREQIHEKEAEIATLKNALNWLDSYSL